MIYPADAESQRRVPTHFPDALRIGVLAGEEGDELRLEAHFMHCEICREPALRLLGKVKGGRRVESLAEGVSCAQARNALFRYFEQGRELTQAEIDHLNTCESCCQHFLDPARCARLHEAEEEIPALD